MWKWLRVKALEQIDAIIGVDNQVEALRQMMQKRSRLVSIPHLMKTQMDVAEHVSPHVAVQKHERMGRCLRNSKAHLVFLRQVRQMLLVEIFRHRPSLQRVWRHSP